MSKKFEKIFTVFYVKVSLSTLDTWAPCKIMRIHTSYNKCTSHDSVNGNGTTLRYFGHIARSAPDEDYHRAVAAAIHKPPSDWKRPPGRPNHTWLRATESDLRPMNIVRAEYGSLLTTLAFDCGHGYAEEEYAMKRQKKGNPYSIAERRVPELIPVLGSQPAGDASHKPGGRLLLLFTRPAVTLATLKRAATNFAIW